MCFSQSCTFRHTYDFDGRKIIRSLSKDITKEFCFETGVRKKTPFDKYKLIKDIPESERTSEQIAFMLKIEERHKAVRLRREERNPGMQQFKETAFHEVQEWKTTGILTLSVDGAWGDCDD